MVCTFSLRLRSVFFFFHRVIFPPHIWSPCSILHTFAFPWILSFHQSLAFLLKWTRSIYGQTEIQSVCVLDRGRLLGKWDVCALRWPSLVLASYFQLVITASVVLPLPHLAQSFGWRRFAALHNMCVPVYKWKTKKCVVSLTCSQWARLLIKKNREKKQRLLHLQPPLPESPSCSRCSSFHPRPRQ